MESRGISWKDLLLGSSSFFCKTHVTIRGSIWMARLNSACFPGNHQTCLRTRDEEGFRRPKREFKGVSRLESVSGSVLRRTEIEMEAKPDVGDGTVKDRGFSRDACRVTQPAVASKKVIDHCPAFCK